MTEEEDYAVAMSSVVEHAYKAVEQFDKLSNHDKWGECYKKIEDQLYEIGGEARYRNLTHYVKTPWETAENLRQISYIEFLARYLTIVSKCTREEMEREAGL